MMWPAGGSTPSSPQQKNLALYFNKERQNESFSFGYRRQQRHRSRYRLPAGSGRFCGGRPLSSRPRGAQQTLEAITAAGGDGRLLSFDVADRQQCREVLEQDMADHGAWYGIVSNAGIARDGAFPALGDDDWDAVIHTNLDSFITSFIPASCR